jgi:hypothetical protein
MRSDFAKDSRIPGVKDSSEILKNYKELEAGHPSVNVV